MLKELAENLPINLIIKKSDFQRLLNQDLVTLVNEKCNVDLRISATFLTSDEIKKIVAVVHQTYEKIFKNSTIPEEQKIFVLNSLLSKLFELWKISSTPEIMFTEIQKIFSPAQIVAALHFCTTSLEDFKWITEFFRIHKNVFPSKKKKILTIGVYYVRFHGGGIESFLSRTIPIYLKLGYKVIFFTDEYDPELEYKFSQPPNENFFKRVILKNPQDKIFQRLHELSDYLTEYEVDLFMSHRHWGNLPIFQILFIKLFGVKMAMEFHGDLHHFVENPFRMCGYLLSDALISLSATAAQCWKNFGVRSYYIPNLIEINGAENFHGRDPKKNSKIILHVGRISTPDDKNSEAALPILKEVVKKIPDVKLKFVGRIDHEEVFQRMKNFIKENYLENNVEFCGYQKNVSSFYKSADVMLNTSPTEGFSLVIAESKFYALPLVLYKLERLEILRDGKGYISVVQGDFLGAAEAIVKILTDTELRCKLSAAAKESIQSFLDYDVAGAWQKVFDDLENNVPISPHKSENAELQNFFIEELWKKQMKINNLIEYISNLKK